MDLRARCTSSLRKFRGMAVTIGSNISALGVRRALDRSSSEVSSTLERLSSGMRINRASDDAAGLAVSTSLTHQARILTRAGLNVSDAVAVVSIADAALGQVSELETSQKP